MSEFYCLIIEFPNIDLNPFYITGKELLKQSYHAHLYTKKDEIELKIFYKPQTLFGEKLMHWSSGIDLRKFGSFLNVELGNNPLHPHLQRIDLSNAKLLRSYSYSDDYEQGDRYIILHIDQAKFYWNLNEEKKHSAEFYLDDKGFRVVQSFYLPLTPSSFFKNDGNFNMRRMRESTRFYKLNTSLFRPEFNFVTKDDTKNRVARITKEPKIQFKYQTGISEDTAPKNGDILLTIISFYHHIKIDYILRRIHLSDCTIVIKNIEQKNFLNTRGNLQSFGLDWSLNQFLRSNWQKETLLNYNTIAKAVELFNQSHLVDNFSAFLIRFNIIDICDKQKSKDDKFSYILNKVERKKREEKALAELLKTIEPNEHEEFKKRWHDNYSKLQYKPMKSQLTSFLESQNLNPAIFPVSIKELRNIRNSIIHGRIDQVDEEQLRKTSILLYRISGILILNLMGIKAWRLNTEIN